MIEAIKTAAISCAVSALISGVAVFYLQSYITKKRQESEEQAVKRRQQRRKQDMLEAQRRRAAGRMFFWIHDALVKGVEHSNGYLEQAFADYNEIEEEQKTFEQELLAEHQDENRRI